MWAVSQRSFFGRFRPAEQPGGQTGSALSVAFGKMRRFLLWY